MAHNVFRPALLAPTLMFQPAFLAQPSVSHVIAHPAVRCVPITLYCSRANAFQCVLLDSIWTVLKVSIFANPAHQVVFRVQVLLYISVRAAAVTCP